MTKTNLASWARRFGAPALGVGVLLACGDVPTDSTNFPPQGVFRGTVIYSGPLPCTQRGHVLGSANLLVFDEDLLPPPEGLGTTATQVGVVPGDILFESVASQLPPTSPDDTVVRCPAADAPHVVVSAPWTIGPLRAGRYQIRGFYDYDGDFSPILKIHQLPTAGDIGGGAIANTTEALAGKPVRYQSFEVGTPDPEKPGKLKIPNNGAIVDGISVSLGLSLPFARPLFHVARVLDERPAEFTDKTGAKITAPPLTPNTDPSKVVLPQDERFLAAPTNYPNAATKMFVRMVLGAGLPDAPSKDRALGAASPYFLQTTPPHDTLWLFPHVDSSGAVLTIPETPPDSAGLKIADLFPQAIFAMLDSTDARNQTALARPAVILQGLVMNQSLLTTLVGSFRDPATGAAKNPQPQQELVVGLRPSVICLPDPTDVQATVYVVTPRYNAINGEPVVDPAGVEKSVRIQLGNRPNIKAIEGCLPRGKFQMNLVYNTGQAWTLPNEAGACLAPESLDADGVTCRQGEFSRQLIPSQNVVLEVGAEREPGFCAATFTGPEYLDGVPKVCLR